jgi:hypothetical protein
MIVETKAKERIIITVAVILLLITLSSGYLFRLPANTFGKLSNIMRDFFVFEISAISLVALVVSRPSSFYYNDSSEVIIIRGSRILLGNILFRRNVLFEIPKRKIRRVSVKRRLGRHFLALTINGRNKIHRVKKVDMGLLTSKEVKAVYHSLSNIATHQDE